MSVGWKIDTSSFNLEASGSVTAVDFFSSKADAPYGSAGCGNMFGGSTLFTIQGGKGHVEASWTAVADLATGGEISGIGHDLIDGGTTFRGSVQYRVQDANGVLILNKAYNRNDMGPGGQAQADHQAILVDAVTYDPNLAAYASLTVTVSFSGNMPNVNCSSGTPGYC